MQNYFQKTAIPVRNAFFFFHKLGSLTVTVAGALIWLGTKIFKRFFSMLSDVLFSHKCLFHIKNHATQVASVTVVKRISRWSCTSENINKKGKSVFGSYLEIFIFLTFFTNLKNPTNYRFSHYCGSQPFTMEACLQMSYELVDQRKEGHIMLYHVPKRPQVL